MGGLHLTLGGDFIVIEMDAAQIREPGCYLHLSSGMLARIFEADLRDASGLSAWVGAGRMVRLSPQPETSVFVLRRTAAIHDYPVSF